MGSDHPGYPGQPGDVLSRLNEFDLVYKICCVQPRFFIGLCVLVMVSGPDQSSELSMLDGDNGSISPDFLQQTVQLEYFDCLMLG